MLIAGYSGILPGMTVLYHKSVILAIDAVSLKYVDIYKIL